MLKCILSILILISSPLFSPGQDNPSCNEAWKIVQTIEKFHFEPRPVDDEFSALVFETFIDELDPEKMFFTQTEIARLEPFKLKIDDEIKSKNCDFLTEVTDLYKQKQEDVYHLLDSIEKQNWDITIVDSLVITEERNFQTKSELMEEWAKRLKLQIMASYVSGLDSGDFLQPPNKESFMEIQSKVIGRAKCRIQAKIEEERKLQDHVSGLFLNAIAHAFDPHTMYFKPETKDLFESMLSKETYSYGIEIFRNQSGKVEIYQIVPGSIAWNSNSLHEGDVILSVKAPGEEILDFDCLSMGEIYRFMVSPKHDHATFFILKKNGKEISIDLHKEKVEVEENVISSFILEGKHKVGYMNLPTFYSPMDGYSYLQEGCARDVATDLIKLKREGIEGLIFDLRDNGGGSMMEAIRLVGIFINFGAVTITSSSDKKLVTLKDDNRGTVFSQPLVILVNSYSASASEL
ncbi:MAG: hypothetical protein KDD63_28855, partial [Bacteroidetes bacterium]|nr:hypothetical protein [Bacteroidota bacterium]